MYVEISDIVICNTKVSTAIPDNTLGRIRSVMWDKYPPTAIVDFSIHETEIAYEISIGNLDVLPPSNSPLNRGDQVRVIESYKNSLHSASRDLVNQIATVRGYDKRDATYLLENNKNHQGYYPIQCLVPSDFTGKKYFYPGQQVVINNTYKIIQETRVSKFKLGQLLLVDGEWVASSQVED